MFYDDTCRNPIKPLVNLHTTFLSLLIYSLLHHHIVFCSKLYQQLSYKLLEMPRGRIYTRIHYKIEEEEEEARGG